MNFIARSYHYLVWLFVISLPFSKAVNSIVLALLFGLSIVIWFKNFRQHNLVSSALLPALFLALYVPSLLVTADISNGLWFLYRQNIYLTLSFSLYIGRAYWLPHVEHYFKWFVLANTSAAVITLILFALPEATVIQITSHIPGFMDYVLMNSRVKFGLYSPFIDRLHFAYLLGMSIFCLIYFFMQGKRDEWQVFSAVTITVTFLLLGGRGAQLGVLFGSVVWLNWLSRPYLAQQYPQWSPRFQRMIQNIIIVGYLIAVPLFFYHFLSPLKSRYQQLFWELKLINNGDYRNWDYQHFTSLRRLLSIRHHLTLIKDNILLGTGVGDFRHELASAYAADPSLSIKIDPNANNKFLFIWANAGLLGLLIFLWTLYKVIRYIYYNTSDAYIKLLAQSFIIFMLVSWLFDIFTVYQTGASFFVFFSTLFLLNPKPMLSGVV